MTPNRKPTKAPVEWRSLQLQHPELRRAPGEYLASLVAEHGARAVLEAAERADPSRLARLVIEGHKGGA